MGSKFSLLPGFSFVRLLAVSEVIELSSGEEDTLHIVDSSESVSEEEEEEEKGGTHVNDVLNQRDALGRVLVNLNHPPEEENVFLAPQLARAVKPHQVLESGCSPSFPAASSLGRLPAGGCHAVTWEVLVRYGEQPLEGLILLPRVHSRFPNKQEGTTSGLPSGRWHWVS